jgi:hypothetical protein
VKGKVLALKRQELQKEGERDYGAFSIQAYMYKNSISVVMETKKEENQD